MAGPGGGSQGTAVGPRGLLLAGSRGTSCAAGDELISSVGSRPGCGRRGAGGRVSGCGAQGAKINLIPHSHDSNRLLFKITRIVLPKTPLLNYSGVVH